MKKLLSILLAISLCFSLVACGSGEGAAPDKKDESAGLVYPFHIVNRPMKVNDVYDYKTVCYSDRSLNTDGHVYIYDYTVEPAGDGMVDKTVKAMFIFDDDNAWNYGMSFDVLYADFVSDDIYDAGEDWTVEINGTEHPVTVLQDEFISGSWTPMGNFVSKYVLTIRMPENYDDIGLFFYNSQNKLNVAGEDNDIPDGTPITSLVDSHSQWFILGGIGDDWAETKTPTYYGQPVDAQINNVAVEDVLGAIPIFDEEEDYGDEAPPPIVDDNNEEIVVDEGFTYVEFDDWSHSSFRREMIYETKIDFTCYNTTPGSYVKAKFWIDDPDNPVNETTVENVYSDGIQIYPLSLIFIVDGTDTTAPSVAFELALYDAEDNCISVTQMDIPFEAEKPADDKQEDKPETVPDENTPWLDIKPAEEYTLNSLSEYTSVNFFYEVHNLKEGTYISYKATSIDNPQAVHDQYEFEVAGDGSISIDVWGEKLSGEYVVFEFQLLDKDRNVLTEKQFNIKVI